MGLHHVTYWKLNLVPVVTLHTHTRTHARTHTHTLSLSLSLPPLPLSLTLPLPLSLSASVFKAFPVLYVNMLLFCYFVFRINPNLPCLFLLINVCKFQIAVLIFLCEHVMLYQFLM